MYKRCVKKLWCNTETEKRKFIHHKSLTLFVDVDIDKIQVSSMISSAKKKHKYNAAQKNIMVKLNGSIFQLKVMIY